jgi:hypothetical protein
MSAEERQRLVAWLERDLLASHPHLAQEGLPPVQRFDAPYWHEDPYCHHFQLGYQV